MLNKCKVIIITGTPGTGKSTLARKLAREKGYFRLDLHRHYKDISLHHDRKSRSYVINEKKFLELVKKKIKEYSAKKGLVIDTHIAHYLPASWVNRCIAVICSDLKELERRLKRRKYPKSKIRENLDCEIFQVCLAEALERGHKVKVIDTSPRGRY